MTTKINYFPTKNLDCVLWNAWCSLSPPGTPRINWFPLDWNKPPNKTSENSNNVLSLNDYIILVVIGTKVLKQETDFLPKANETHATSKAGSTNRPGATNAIKLIGAFFRGGMG